MDGRMHMHTFTSWEILVQPIHLLTCYWRLGRSYEGQANFRIGHWLRIKPGTVIVSIDEMSTLATDSKVVLLSLIP